ncbi:MAG TPA: hypothetical protein VI391_09600 [Thermoanaerobaculia bacterium]
MTGIPLVPKVQRHRIFGGLTERQEHIFTWIGVVVVLLYVAGWAGAIREDIDQQREIAREQQQANINAAPPPPAPPSQQITSSLTSPGAPTAAFVSNALLSALAPLRGASGEVFFTTRTPNTQLAPGINVVAPKNPGIYNLSSQLGQAIQSMSNFSLITLVPFSAKQNGHIGLYYIGSWPFEHGGKPKTPAYANPTGFIQVTPQNEDTQVSEHFKLRDFVTKGQENVWPKYMLLNPKLLDKLELTIQELEKMGHPVKHVTIMSGFRTPNYNYTGGNTEGRANLSRHMYGDASDIFIDNDGNGVMDDLNGDHRVDIHDAEVVLQAVERVERAHPELVGGVGVYSACCGHGPFTHIDVRGYRARWRGFGNG